MERRYTEQDLPNAIKDVNSGKSQAESTKRWGVPRQTLIGRLKGNTSRQEAMEPLQRLSSMLEKRLCGWIIMEHTIGNEPTPSIVRGVAGKLAVNGGDEEPIGKNWLEGLLQRNPEVKGILSKRVDVRKSRWCEQLLL